ncbi:hypothetical protein AAG906_035255 [Vitis piasezkii]
MLRTKTDVKYIGDEAVIVPLDVPVSATYEHLLSMIYSRTGIDKNNFKYVEQMKMKMKKNVNPKKLFTKQWKVNKGDMSLWMGKFENVENIGNAVSSDWTPWGNTNIGNSGGEFMVGQVFNSKADLQHAAKLYSISAHQEYVVVESTTKLLVLRCKKAKQSQCPWKLRAMVVKALSACTRIDGTHLYDKYKGTLMIAMGCDGNNQLFPLAFALTEDENIDSWGWFLTCIRTRVTHRRGLCVISDRHPGIMAIMSDVHLGWSEPYAYHREYTPYVDAKIKANVVKAGSHEIVLYDHIRGQFHVKTNKEDIVRSDSLDTSVLVLQDRHKSHLVDSGRLVERWRPKTHTFHLPVGEMTITLRIFFVILGLRIHGLPINGTCDIDCAVLAHLYRELCRASLDGATDIAGCVTLLQRLHMGRLDFGRPPIMRSMIYRWRLDHGLLDEALLHEGLLADPLGCRWRVPLSWAQNPSRVLTFYRDRLDACTHDRPEIWRTMSPLICFDIVEWHRPERV